MVSQARIITSHNIVAVSVRLKYTNFADTIKTEKVAYCQTTNTLHNHVYTIQTPLLGDTRGTSGESVTGLAEPWTVTRPLFDN